VALQFVITGQIKKLVQRKYLKLIISLADQVVFLQLSFGKKQKIKFSLFHPTVRYSDILP